MIYNLGTYKLFPPNSSISNEKELLKWLHVQLFGMKAKVEEKKRMCRIFDCLIQNVETDDHIDTHTRIRTRVDQFRNGHYLHKEQQAQEQNALAHKFTCA